MHPCMVLRTPHLARRRRPVLLPLFPSLQSGVRRFDWFPMTLLFQRFLSLPRRRDDLVAMKDRRR